MGKYIVFLDESGDHSMENIDKNFPVFALLMLVCELGDYTRKIIPAVVEFKLEECGSEAVIIHSRDIRKATGDFGFMHNPERRNRVYTALNGLMENLPYGIIASVIHKVKQKSKYIAPYHPYHLSLEFLLERLLIFLRQKQNQNDVVIFAESRGKKEDNELELEFLRILNQGTNQMAASEFKTMNILLRFVKKEGNVIGTQLADLAVYPIAQTFTKEDTNDKHRSYPIVSKKLIILQHDWMKALKVFP